jgi:hypothetical protein
MTQIIRAEPHDQQENCLPCKQASYVPSAKTAEHAALVEAIRLKFPEIYQAPAASQNGSVAGEHRGLSPMNRNPALA